MRVRGSHKGCASTSPSLKVLLNYLRRHVRAHLALVAEASCLNCIKSLRRREGIAWE